MSDSTRSSLEKLRIREPKARARRFPLFTLLLVALLPVAFYGGYRLKGERPGLFGGAPEVSVGLVRATDTAERTETGGFTDGGWIEVPSYHPIIVSALIPGRVEELAVLEGDAVERDQIVARLYALDLTEELRLAEAELSEARASLALYRAGYRREDVAKAKADVERLTAEARLAMSVAKRTAELVPLGAASPEDAERDDAGADTARARLAGAREELARLTAGFREEEVAKAEATVERACAGRDLAERRLSYTEVKSPASGRVLERFVTEGTWLSAGNPRVVSLYDPGDLQVRVDVRQESASRLRIGQEVSISVEAEPEREYEGEVIRVEPLADLKKNTVQAKIRIREASPALHPEMICRVRFREETKKVEPETAEQPRPLLPIGSVVREGDRSFVFLVRKDRAHRVEVRLGERRGDDFLVLAGVRAGDRVILSPSPELEDGQAIRKAAP